MLRPKPRLHLAVESQHQSWQHAAQVASPGTQVTIQFTAMALEQAEDTARASEQSLHENLENRTITVRHCGAGHTG